jgi:hypothetical protein
VALIAALLGFQVVRTAMVRQFPSGTALWPGHPAGVLNQAMAEIGATAARGEKLSPLVLAKVDGVARQVPLASEPFLIHGAVAQMDGQDRRAERLYVEARNRDPRSPAARYFLTERYLQSGRVEQALSEMAVLSRLTNAVGVFAPALAAYAKTPGAVRPLRRFFRAAPEFEPYVLSNLAADPRNLGLITALWTRSPAADPADAQWQGLLVAKLVEAGDFRRAQAVWREFAGLGIVAPGVFNPEFRKLAAPPPFNWTFGSAGGLAQPAGTGQLELIYFGREEAVLAEQMLMLAPGRYGMGMQVSGEIKPGSGIAWSVECATADKQSLLTLPLERQSAGRLQGGFTVPAGCPTQRLRLSGSPGDFPRTVEFTLSRFQLQRAGG